MFKAKIMYMSFFNDVELMHVKIKQKMDKETSTPDGGVDK